jgi:hypothetical protein
MKKISFWRPFSKKISSECFASEKTLESVFFASATLDSSFGVKVSGCDNIEEIAREKCLSEVAERAVFFASIGEIGLREPLLFSVKKLPPSHKLQGQIEFPHFENSKVLEEFFELQNSTSVGYSAERTQSPLFLNCMNELQERAILLNQPYLSNSESHLFLDEISGEIFQLCSQATPNGLHLHLSFGPLGTLIAVRDSVSGCGYHLM